MKSRVTSRWIALRTPEGEYLRATGGDWGPSHLPGPFAEATLFPEGGEWGIREAERAWGGKLTRVTVQETRIREIL